MKKVEIEVNEETIGRMLKGMQSQGWERSVDGNGTCAYVGINGRRCVVGWMVDEEEAKELDRHGGPVIGLGNEGVVTFQTDEDRDFLDMIQLYHDQDVRPDLREQRIRHICHTFLNRASK